MTVFVIVAIVIVAGILIFVNVGDDDSGTTTTNGNGAGSGGAGSGSGSGSSGSNSGPQTFTVTITDSGYSPQSLTISPGDNVIWRNDGAQENWPASAMHPTHRVYPGSDIEKCGTAEENNIFDACKGLATGEDYTFEFDEVGTWNYHDHLHANLRGNIIVESIVN